MAILTMLDICSDVVRAGVCVGRGDIHVQRPSWGVKGEMGVHPCHLTSICVHAASSLARFDITPDHRGHVTVVVHEARIEVWNFVGIGRVYMDEATREGIFLSYCPRISHDDN